MALIPELLAALDDIDVKPDDKFKEFLVTNGVTSISSFAVLAASEDNLEKHIIEPAVSEGVPKSIKLRVFVSKAWLACRAIMNDETKKRAKPKDDRLDVPLEEPEDSLLRDGWERQRRFMMSTLRL